MPYEITFQFNVFIENQRKTLNARRLILITIHKVQLTDADGATRKVNRFESTYQELFLESILSKKTLLLLDCSQFVIKYVLTKIYFEHLQKL